MFGLLLLAAGVIGALWPRGAWYVSTGWQFKDAEPSELAIVANRVVGLILSVIGAFMLFSSCAADSEERAWVERFQKRVANHEVRTILYEHDNKRATDEELELLVSLMKNAELQKFEAGSVYGATTSGSIIFKDGQRLELVIFGPSGGIELHPSGMKYQYRIVSPQLETWFRERVQ